MKDNIQRIQFEQIRELVAAEGRYALQLIKLLPIAICVTDSDGNFRVVNSSYCRLYGYKEGDILGKHFSLVVPERNRERMSKLHGAFIGKKFELAGEWEVIDSKGIEKKILANAAYVLDSDGSPYKITFVLDITDRSNAKNHLQGTIELLRREIAARDKAEGLMLHDLMKPINSMKGIIGLINDRSDEEELERYIALLETLVDRAQRVAGSYMGIVKMEAGNYQIEWTSLDVGKVLGDLIISNGWNDEGIPKIKLYGNGTIMADELFFSMMLENLLSNAVEASSGHSKISVNILNEAENLSIKIHNDGAVPEGIKDRFFEKFTTSGKRNGTGIGTYMARLIARYHGGDIGFVTSEEKGTTLTITLPIGKVEITAKA